LSTGLDRLPIVTRNPEGETLRSALVGVYAPYLTAVLKTRGTAVPETLAAAVDEGAVWLDEVLGTLLALPFRDQARGPLEVFQEAMRFPTGALLAAGVQRPQRDEAAASALPGDHYDLAPASSQDLGEDVWAAHIAWGAAKARAFRPSVSLLSGDPMDRSKVEPVVVDAGFRLVVWRDASAVDLEAVRPVTALIDLSHPDADDVIRAVAESGIRVIGFGSHVDDMALVRARTLGAADALPRSVFFRSLARLLPTQA
jgi:hypothetical protein